VATEVTHEEVAERYAEALFEAIEDKGDQRLKDALDTLRSISEAINASEDLQAALRHPKISIRAKKKMMNAIAGKAGASVEVERLLDIAVKKGRQLLIPQITEEFTDFVFERLGVIRGEVLAGKSLGDDLKKYMEENLVKILGKKVDLTFREDPALIAGAVIRVGHLSLDASVSGELDRMAEEMGWKE
jgi:F-type H+-transporting ATPase subunit delta